MRQFIILYGLNKEPLAVGGVRAGGILFTKTEAEDRINKANDPDVFTVLEISSRPVEIVTNKRGIV